MRKRFRSGPQTGAHEEHKAHQIILVLALSVLWALVGFGPPVLTGGATRALPGWRLYPGQVRALAVSRRMPPVTARAAVLADAKTGQILLSKNPDQPLPPASTTKVMTALIVLERGHLDDVVTVPADALIGEASMGLRAGERITVHDLLYGMLMVSGNDAAMALADYVAGSAKAFATLMNQKAAQLGLTHTHFVNPHGLDAPGHLASATDLLTIARAGLKNKLFAKIVSTPRARIAGRLLINRNQLLTTYPGADGVKTGTTDAAGQCLVASATRQGHRAIAVVLGSQDRYADARALLDHYFTYFGWRKLTLPPGELSRVHWSDGRVRELAATSEPEVLLPRWQWPLVHAVCEISGDGTAGSPAGQAIFRVGPKTIAEVPLRWREP
ncbi:MAG: D-alanyl-D-alanine carboxypeptidase [Anaerolineae bacterium]|nr:D-alanyl-D-alanine carboxypeptidase [Anaerolineae bacterium]